MTLSNNFPDSVLIEATEEDIPQVTQIDTSPGYRKEVHYFRDGRVETHEEGIPPQ